MGEFLNTKISTNFRKAINESNIFNYDPEHKENYNLFCAVMDRMDSSVLYLNNNANPPKTEQELLFFVMYSCMILDGVKHLLKSLDLSFVYDKREDDDSCKFFKDICLSEPLNISEEECPTDNKFFEYFRSLSMAHPFETNRPKFFQKKEIQYSPFVIPNSNFMSIRGINDGIGIRIYSNKFEEIKDLVFSFNTLKEYINSRFILMEKATKKVYQIIAEKEDEWKKEKVTRNLSPIETLEEIIELLKRRHEDTYKVELVIKMLDYPLTEIENKDIVSLYREVITNSIPYLIESIEELNYEKLEDIFYNILYVRPKLSHEMAHYQLEKIYGYLNIGDEESSNYAWGLQQAQFFSDKFAKKWVKININEMDAEEIKLLIRIACYFEKEEQLKGTD